jgi:hypothetical protein
MAYGKQATNKVALPNRGATERPGGGVGNGSASVIMGGPGAKWQGLVNVGESLDVDTTPTGTDVSVGQAVGGIVDLGKVDQRSIGQYHVAWQDKASASADGLGVQEYLQFRIEETSAAVFTAVSEEVVGPVLIGHNAGIIVCEPALALNGANADSELNVVVATATMVTHAAAWTIPATLVAGNLYLIDAIAASSHAVQITRIM